MSQKSSLPQVTRFVSRSLMPGQTSFFEGCRNALAMT